MLASTLEIVNKFGSQCYVIWGQWSTLYLLLTTLLSRKAKIMSVWRFALQSHPISVMVVIDNVFKTSSVTEIVTAGRMRWKERSASGQRSHLQQHCRGTKFQEVIWKRGVSLLFLVFSQIKSRSSDRGQHACFRHSSFSNIPLSGSLKMMFN